jgi:hypothetical protein
VRREERLLLAFGLVLLDLVVVVVPLAALVAAYVLVVRPPWFREWIENLYGGD